MPRPAPGSCSKAGLIAAAIILALASATTPRAQTAFPPPPRVDVVPQPLRVDLHGSEGVSVRSGTPIVVARGDLRSRWVADWLSALTLRTRGLRLTRTVGGRMASQAPAIVFERRAGEPVGEGYSLDVSERGIVIQASSDAGLFYGAVTLWQMLTPDGGRGGVSLPGVHIEDQPRFPWRGLLIDSARHFQSVAFIKRLIDTMALHKLNVLQWHLTDDQAWRLEVRKYPRLTQIGAWRAPVGADTEPQPGPRREGSGRGYGGFYTEAEVRDLVAYAAARNVTIVPEIEMPGHALSAILAYPELGLPGALTRKAQSDWGVFPSIYNTDDHTFAFLEDVLAEVMRLFPSRFIAIGGDEAVKDYWNASPEVQAKMKTLGVANDVALQSWFVRRIGAFLNAHGRRLIGWDDILQCGSLPEDDAVVSWRGVDGALAAVRSGHDVVMATDPTLYFDHRQADWVGEPPGRGRIVSLSDVYGYDPGRPPLPPPPPPPAPGAAPAPPPVGPAPACPSQPGASALAPLNEQERTHILGIQANIWTEHIRTEARLEQMAFPRAAAVAESGWTAEENRNWPSFVARLPALLARYRSLELHADQGAVAIQLTQALDESGRSRVTLSNQVGFGEIRYTTDGSAPSMASPVYAGPLQLPLPARLRAVAFAGGAAISPSLDQVLDRRSALRRPSQGLKLCTNKLVLNVEGGGPVKGERPVFLADILNPCWIYPAADMAGIGALSISVGQSPFNFQLGADRKKIVLRPPATPDGELDVRVDGCDGEFLAVLPLTPGRLNDGVTTLTAAIPPHAGVHDLCLSFTARNLDRLWAVNWVQLHPGALAPAAGS